MKSTLVDKISFKDLVEETGILSFLYVFCFQPLSLEEMILKREEEKKALEKVCC